MQKWEYIEICDIPIASEARGIGSGVFIILPNSERTRIDDTDGLGVNANKALNDYGEQGWEVTGAFNFVREVGVINTWTLKRPKE